MAIEWLLAKSLIAVDKETVTPVVSMTAVGERYHAKQSPIEEVLGCCARCGRNRTAVDDSRSAVARTGSTPPMSARPSGRLKKEGVLLIVQGGCIESTGRPSPTAERLRTIA